MARLILVKHAPPLMAPEVASARWVLSEEGRRRCGWLAEELAGHGVTRLYASLEPKALETAALVAVRLGLEVRPRPGLHENDRTGFPFGTTDFLRQTIGRFFAEPTTLAMGIETAEAAAARFGAAIRALRAESGDETAAVVTHGTVLTTLVAGRNGLSPFAFWDWLGLPSYVALDADSFRLDGPVHNFPASG